jgi:AcrR family transcriptional regulator
MVNGHSLFVNAMTGRPRRVEDQEILAATARVIGRLGPTRLTLADVGREVGLAAPTLVKRFGTKRQLLLALASQGAESADEWFAAVRARHRDPLEAVLDVATLMAREVESPAVLANHLAFLQIDLSDPEFHALALAQAVRAQAGYESLLADAVRQGRLEEVDVVRLASAVNSTASGALIAWAIRPEGSAAEAVTRDVAMLLDAYRAAPRATEAGRPGPRVVARGPAIQRTR